LEDVPEHEGYGCEELQRCGYVFVFGEVAEDFGGVVEDGGSGQTYHGDGEKGAELESEDNASDDSQQGHHESPFDESTEEGEIFAGVEGDGGESGESCEGNKGGTLDGAGGFDISYIEEGDEDDGFGQDEQTQRSVLGTFGFGVMGSATGEPADDDESAEDKEPTDTEHSLGHGLCDACGEEGYFDTRKEHDGAEEVHVGAGDELGAGCAVSLFEIADAFVEVL